MSIYKSSFPDEEFAQRFPDADAVAEGLTTIEILYHENQDKESSYEKGRLSRSQTALKDAEELDFKLRQLPSAQSAVTQAEADGDPDVIELRKDELKKLTDRIKTLESRLEKASVGQVLHEQLTSAAASALAESAEERGNAILDWLETGSTGFQGTFKFLKRSVVLN
ncbi:hypothetical protein V6R21_07230 [Limibacter armeniacum]|uniref:hypothetical protein n=1 Tax=Limibacter armeniacum TaxID=466084 RepID=UPI002FE6A3AD